MSAVETILLTVHHWLFNQKHDNRLSIILLTAWLCILRILKCRRLLKELIMASCRMKSAGNRYHPFYQEYLTLLQPVII